MRHYFDSVVNAATGRPLVGAQVRVLDSNGDLASIYSDENGTPATNPLTVQGGDTSSPGLFQFYADDGFYTLEYVYAGGTILTIPDVDISADMTNAQAAASTGAGLIGTTGGGTVQDYIDYASEAIDQRLFNIGLFTAASTKTVPATAPLVITSGYSVAGKGSARYVYDAAVDSSYVSAHPRTSFLTANGRGYRIAEARIGLSMVGGIMDFTDLDDPYTIDTEAWQALADACKFHEIPGYAEAGGSVVDGPIEWDGPPLEQDPYSYIVPIENVSEHPTGYTVLSITSNASRSTYSGRWSIRIQSNVAEIGDRPTLNGVVWEGLAGGWVDQINVNSLDGFGVKLLAMWDTTVIYCSSARCGNADEYAFSMDTGGNGHCNESSILRLQVEEPQEKAISVAGGTINCFFGLIHSERAHSTSFIGLGEETWILSGNCEYAAIRLSKESTSTVPPRAFVGGQGLAAKLRVEDDIPVRLGWLSGTEMVIRSGSTFAGAINAAGNAGTVLIDGAVIASAAGDLTGCIFRTCQIAAFAPQSPFVAEGCTITAYTDHESAQGFWRNCDLTGTFTNLAGVHNFSGMHFGGNMLDATGDMSCVFDDGCYCSGTVHADYAAAPSGGSWTAGQRTKNLAPATSQPRGWTLVAGSGWVNEGNF